MQEEQPTFDGFPEVSKYGRFKETSTRGFIQRFFESREPTETALDYANSLICIAVNIDRYISAPTPKNISTLMDAYNATMQALRDLYPETVSLDDDISALMAQAAR